MSVSSRQGVFAFGPQIEKDALATTFYKHKALDVNLGGIELTERWEAEVGGSVFNDGQRKTAAMAGGTVVMQPRLENTIGWLLYALCGECETSGAGPTYEHVFKPADDHSFLPWITAQKLVPAPPGEDEMGEMLQDCKLEIATFSLATMAPLTVAFGMEGRVATFPDPSGWEYDNSEYEETESIPIGNKGLFKLPSFSGDELPTPSVEISVVNTPSTQRLADEIMIGSYYPDDIAITERTVTVRFMHKWKNPDLWKQIYTGSAVGTEWTPEIYNTDLEARLESPVNIGATEIPYSIQFDVASVDWAAEGPVRLMGNNILYQPFVGEIKAGAGDPFTITLVNDQAAYSWPVSGV